MNKRQNFNHKKLIGDVTGLLAKSGPLSAVEICKSLGISQPVFSRLIAGMNDSVLTTGKARTTLYALKRSVNGIMESIPVYQIEENGKAQFVARLHGVYPKGFYYEHKEKKLRRFFENMPYFLDDLRPSGFLGRLLPKIHAEHNFPKDVRTWSDEHCLQYLTKFGWDLIGNLIIGDEAFKLYLIKKQNDSKETYPELAEKVLNFGIAGSSAGGEQAKFLTVRNNIPVLVKFTPQVVDKKTQRLSDLLICEHIVHNLFASRSAIIIEDKRTFLEIERFDRDKNIGRRGIISLHAMDIEFVGKMGTWWQTSQGLLIQKRINKAIFDKICRLELFGHLIGNTDMHNGNLSFFVDGEQIKDLAPVYDMLPMMYMPQYEELVYNTIEPIRHIDKINAETWKNVYPIAKDFWSKVIEHPQVSFDFKEISKKNLEKLLDLKDLQNKLP